MKVIYVAGPFRAKNSWQMEQNIRLAEEVALKLWGLGAAVICPHANTRFFQGYYPDGVWLLGDLEILDRCDGIVLCGDWQRSAGSVAEHAYAVTKGKAIFFWGRKGGYPDSIVDWINKEREKTHD